MENITSHDLFPFTAALRRVLSYSRIYLAQKKEKKNVQKNISLELCRIFGIRTLERSYKQKTSSKDSNIKLEPYSLNLCVNGPVTIVSDIFSLILTLKYGKVI